MQEMVWHKIEPCEKHGFEELKLYEDGTSTCRTCGETVQDFSYIGEDRVKYRDAKINTLEAMCDKLAGDIKAFKEIGQYAGEPYASFIGRLDGAYDKALAEYKAMKERGT